MLGKNNTDEELMLLSSSGNKLAFELLYERYFDKLIRFALHFDIEINKAEDTVQEVFFSLIKHPEKFDRNRKFSTWIYTVTANYCKNKLRTDTNRLRIQEENIKPFLKHSSSIDEQIDKKQMQVALEKGLSELSEKEQFIYSMRFEYDMALNDIASILHIPEGSVRSAQFYLLKKLAQHLKDFKHAYQQ